MTLHSAGVSVPVTLWFPVVAVPGSAVCVVICPLWSAAAGCVLFATSYRALTTTLDYQDTWQIAAGIQHRLSEPWLLNFGVTYDSGAQNGLSVSPRLPVNSARGVASA